MSLHHTATAFVFKKEDRLEADRIFSVFTLEYGRLEIFAKAIRKITSKLKAGIELFYLADISFVQGRNKKTLTDALATQKFLTIASVPEKMEIASQVASLLEDFIRGEQQDEQIFSLLKETFERLDQNPARKLVYYYFFWNFVSLLGYAPDLSAMSPKTAGLVKLIMHRDWAKLAAAPADLATQTSLKEVSQKYHRYLYNHIT